MLKSSAGFRSLERLCALQPFPIHGRGLLSDEGGSESDTTWEGIAAPLPLPVSRLPRPSCPRRAARTRYDRLGQTRICVFSSYSEGHFFFDLSLRLNGSTELRRFVVPLEWSDQLRRQRQGRVNLRSLLISAMVPKELLDSFDLFDRLNICNLETHDSD